MPFIKKKRSFMENVVVVKGSLLKRMLHVLFLKGPNDEHEFGKLRFRRVKGVLEEVR